MSFIIRRLIYSIIILIIVSIIVFLALRLLPGDPLLIYIFQNQMDQLSPSEIQELRVHFGLDKPLPLQYFDWMGGLFHGSFGTSMFSNVPVIKLLAERLPVTIHLGVLAFILSATLGIVAGMVCALRQGSRLDSVLTSIANFGISVPVFWLGILMIYLFGLFLGWLPIQGYTSPFTNFWLSTRQLIMPVLCMSVVSLASNTRQTRSSMLEVVQQDYIRTAWAKGLRERVIVIRHIMKNGLIPVITLMGMHVGHIIGGSVLIEMVFNIPGMGRLMVEAIYNQDYQIVQGGSLVIAAMIVLSNLAVDISYGWLDPRIRYR
jgi:peptide/nickel transport system permease protein